MGGAITATPVIYNGRIYVGVAGTGAQFDPDGGHFFAVVDAENMTKMRELPIKGYPQASALLSTAYEDEDFNGDGEADGRVYIYFTYNALPGGIIIHTMLQMKRPRQKRAESFSFLIRRCRTTV